MIASEHEKCRVCAMKDSDNGAADSKMHTKRETEGKREETLFI